MKKIAMIFIASLGLMFYGGLSHADVIIIGNPAIKLDSITPEQIKRLYLARNTSINGIELKLSDCKPLQEEFLSKFIGKSVRKYNKTWLKQIFAEGVTAPVVLKDADEVIDFVKGSPNAIGYVSSAPGDVKVLLK